MTLEIAKGNYISRIWFIYRQDAGFDVLGHLTQKRPAGPWVFAYRFRYYEDDRAHDSKDRKSGWRAELGGELPEREVIVKMTEILSMMKATLFRGFTFDEMIVQSDDPEVVIPLLREKRWAHLKVEDPAS